jgi:SAM-dependent methyltransferase
VRAIDRVSDGVEPWEAAYLRFEQPEDEVKKFIHRLDRMGAARWPRDAKILELFCGRGNGLVALERLGFTHIHGVDLSPRLVRLYDGSGTCLVGDCRTLPVREGSQDVAIVQGGLHHLPDLSNDLGRVVEEVQRILKPGGLFVVVEPWLTPFLRLVHWGCRGSARRFWTKLDALATMIDYEGETYMRWLRHPEFVSGLLSGAFEPQINQQRWGKLLFVGRKRRS